MTSSVSASMAMAMVGDGYRYVGQLGVGGGGVVLLAHHTAMNRMVAVKAVVTQSRSALARLRREGRVLAALDHRGILEVYRLVEEGSVLALVTEYMDGGDFDDALANQHLSGRESIAVLDQVGAALGAAHAAGLVHRDIKPSNVLLGRDGRAVLADFGLTRLGGEFRTQSGAITGTPMYMAPEQITSPDDESPMLDVYSYGALTYQALTGRPPFVARDLRTLADMHLTAKPDSPQQVRPGIPKPVCDIVLGTLAKKPKDRPALREVLAVLGRVDPDLWDALLPERREREEASRPDAPPAGAATDAGDVTAGGGTEVGDDDDDHGTDLGVALPRRLIVSDAPARDLQQPVFVPKRTRRWLTRTLIIAGGVLVGLLIGIVVLMLI